MKLLRKLFLVREIVSRSGVVHFRRYRLLETPILRLYVHQIMESDKDGDLHDHPWGFFSLILKGHYVERRPHNVLTQCRPGTIFHRRAIDVHCIDEVLKPAWTFVVAYGRRRQWGYQTDIGWVDHQTYRELKRSTKTELADESV